MKYKELNSTTNTTTVTSRSQVITQTTTKVSPEIVTGTISAAEYIGRRNYSNKPIAWAILNCYPTTDQWNRTIEALVPKESKGIEFIVAFRIEHTIEKVNNLEIRDVEKLDQTFWDTVFNKHFLLLTYSAKEVVTV